MSTASPTAFALWALLSILFLVFLVHHLWCYDRFKCLRWSAGQHGAFKRVMTYSYLGAVPLLVVYSVGMAVIKYREGFLVTPSPDNSIIPVPINSYRDANKRWVLPLQFVFSFAWALEMVTHLEELAFWLYLLHQNPQKEAWFSSWEYRLWYLGSLVSILGMPLTAFITRRDLQTCDAYIFLVGSAGSTTTTLAFLYVLWRFPMFIKHVKAEGADPTVVVRLATFYALNQVRVVFRFMFTIPLLIVALDGIIGNTHPINRNLFATDFLQMIAGLGCFVSSMITLLIFFPRSIVREAGYKPKLSSTIPNSPKSPMGSPTSQAAVFAVQTPHPTQIEHHLPAHMAGYATPNGLRMSVTGGTGWTTTTGMTGVTGTAMTTDLEESAYSLSMYSPRESLEVSPKYSLTAEEDEFLNAQRRRQRISRRASRRLSTYSARMDAHLEFDEVSEGDGHLADVSAEHERDDEERAPPYSDPHSHPYPPPAPPASIPPPTQAHLQQRPPLAHSFSNPNMPTSPNRAAPIPPNPLSSSTPYPPPPQAKLSVSSPVAHTPMRSSSPSSISKQRTMDWEEQGPASLGNAAGVRGLRVITAAPGSNVPLGVGLGMSVSGAARRVAGAGGAGMSRSGAGAGNLHPYVVNFTSPIDLVDLPPRDELPRAV